MSASTQPISWQALGRGQALAHYLTLVSENPRAFDWQANNCAQFAGQWVRRCTGADALAGVAMPPDAKGAMRLVRRLGGSFAGAVTERLGVPPDLGSLAQVGDVAMVDLDLGPLHVAAQYLTQMPGIGKSLGLCAGRHVACLTNEGHVMLLDLRLATHRWSLTEISDLVQRKTPGAMA